MLVALSIPSVITTVAYIQDGDLELVMGEELCAAAAVPILIMMHIPVIVFSFDLLGAVRTTHGRRGAYMLLILPIVLWSFIFASLSDGFVPSFLFGFPIFLLVAALLPLGAIYVRRDVLTTLTDPMKARLVCRRCGAPVELHPTDRFVKCRWCKEYNSNPFGPSIRLDEMMVEGGEETSTASRTGR